MLDARNKVVDLAKCCCAILPRRQFELVVWTSQKFSCFMKSLDKLLVGCIHMARGCRLTIYYQHQQQNGVHEAKLSFDDSQSSGKPDRGCGALILWRGGHVLVAALKPQLARGHEDVSAPV